MWWFGTPSRLVFDFPKGRTRVLLVFVGRGLRGWGELWESKWHEEIVRWREHMAIVTQDQYGKSLRAGSSIKNDFQTLFLCFRSPPLLHNRVHCLAVTSIILCQTMLQFQFRLLWSCFAWPERVTCEEVLASCLETRHIDSFLYLPAPK